MTFVYFVIELEVNITQLTVKGKLSHMGFLFLSQAISSTDYDNIVLSKVTAEISEVTFTSTILS